MSKVKVIERSQVMKELDIEYPIYLYFQDDFYSEYKMVTEDSCIKVVYDVGECYIKQERWAQYLTEDEIKRNTSTEEDFREALNELVTRFNSKL